MFKYISLQDISGFFQHYFVKRFLRGYFFAFAGLLKKEAAVVVCCAWICAKADTNDRNEEPHFLFIAVIDVTSKTVILSFDGTKTLPINLLKKAEVFFAQLIIPGRRIFIVIGILTCNEIN